MRVCVLGSNATTSAYLKYSFSIELVFKIHSHICIFCVLCVRACVRVCVNYKKLSTSAKVNACN